MTEETFDEKYSKVIEEMQEYLIDQRIDRIAFTFTSGWKFSLSIPSKSMDKILKDRGLQQTVQGERSS